MRKSVLFLVCLLSVILFLEDSTITFAANKTPAAKPAANKEAVAAKVVPIPPVIEEKKVLEGTDTFSIMNPTFSKDGKYLAAYFNGAHLIRIYDTQTGNELAQLDQTLLYGDKFVDGMAFTGPDCSKLIVMRSEAPLKVIDWKTKKVEKELDLGVTGYKIYDFAFTPNQEFLAVAKQDGIDVWNYAQSKKVKSLMSGQKINAIDISNDGNYLAFAKSGKPADSVGTVDIKTLDVFKKPLANIPVADKSKLPDYEVQMVDFSNGYDIIAGYLNLPAGTFKPDGPAGIYLINTQKNGVDGPLSLSDYRLATAKYLAPFHGILTSAFNFKDDGSVTSALDFVDPHTMKIMKTYNNTMFKAPMLAVGFSPDSKMMAAALKEAAGVKLYLFSLKAPEANK